MSTRVSGLHSPNLYLLRGGATGGLGLPPRLPPGPTSLLPGRPPQPCPDCRWGGLRAFVLLSLLTHLTEPPPSPSGPRCSFLRAHRVPDPIPCCPLLRASGAGPAPTGAAEGLPGSEREALMTRAPQPPWGGQSPGEGDGGPTGLALFYLLAPEAPGRFASRGSRRSPRLRKRRGRRRRRRPGRNRNKR